jgi:hypothetical protein
MGKKININNVIVSYQNVLFVSECLALIFHVRLQLSRLALGWKEGSEGKRRSKLQLEVRIGRKSKSKQ